MPFNLYTLFNIEPTHNTVLGALLYLSTLERSWSSNSGRLRHVGNAATIPAPSTGWCSDLRGGCRIYFFFSSGLRINSSAGTIPFASKNFIASLLVEIGNLGGLVVWNRKGSERSEKQKIKNSFILPKKVVFENHFPHFLQQGKASVWHTEGD